MKKQNEKILVTGAGGFIGHHMVKFLQKKGYWVRGVDIKYPEFSPKDEADEFIKLDLREYENALKATEGMDKVYNFAANMGGVGFIEVVHADVMHDNVKINANMAKACTENGVKRVFYSSSACVYPISKQTDAEVTALKEEDAYPADPDNGYGWEKLFSEQLFESFAKDYGLEVRIARYHNIFGPESVYEGGREKAPTAICRKVAKAKDGSEVKVWGDGKQTRSFCFIEDCLKGTYKLMESEVKEPLNIGSDRLIAINDLVDMVTGFENKDLEKKHLLDKPQGVRGRNSDNTKLEEKLNWVPEVSLDEGMKRTYDWIKEQVER